MARKGRRAMAMTQEARWQAVKAARARGKGLTGYVKFTNTFLLAALGDLTDTVTALGRRIDGIEVEREQERITRGCSGASDGDSYVAALVRRVEQLEARQSLSYRGVYRAGIRYQPQDAVTWGGSLWVAQEATDAKPGEAEAESRSWRLAVKRGKGDQVVRSSR